MRLNEYVFERAYDLAASESRDGVAKYFIDIFEHESYFDRSYDLLSQ